MRVSGRDSNTYFIFLLQHEKSAVELPVSPKSDQAAGKTEMDRDTSLQQSVTKMEESTSGLPVDKVKQYDIFKLSYLYYTPVQAISRVF